MQRDPLAMIFLRGLGFTVFGNLLGGIMMISLAPFLELWFIPYIAILFTLFIYGSLIFLGGMRDGQKEFKLHKHNVTESIPKQRWIIIGLLLAVIMLIPCVILLMGTLGAITITGEYVFAFRFICGAISPMFYIAGLNDPTLAITDYPLWYHIAIMGIYLAVTPVCAHIGYKFGYEDKNFGDFMYEK